MEITASVRNQTKHAIYLPAIQPAYALGVMKPKASRKLPAGASLQDLNFFRPGSKFFNLDAGLYSAGQIKDHRNPPRCMVSTRARASTLVMGDSGGYQIATGQLGITPNKREDIFHWLVNTCDLAMTLDVPTRALQARKTTRYLTFDDCLYGTLGHLEAFKALGGEQWRFLNVLQGLDLQQSDVWYDAVKRYNFYGWAISGSQKKTLKHLLWRVLHLIKDGKFDKDETWLHFLGVSDLKTAVLLTTLRDVLQQKFPSCTIQVSYDTSTPFFMAGTKLSALDRPTLSASTLRIPSYQIDKASWANSREKFPYKFSTISQFLRKGDIIRRDWTGATGPDNLGYLMLMNHNVEVQVASIDALHSLLESGLPRQHLQQLLPRYLLEAMDEIEAVLMAPTLRAAWDRLQKKKTLRILDNGYRSV